MCATKVPYRRRIKLLADYQGYPDGRIVLFKVWRQKGNEKENLWEVTGVTKGGKAIGWWTPYVRREVLPLEKEIEEETEETKYYFIAKIDDKEVKSEDITLVYPLEIYLEDEEKLPISDAECTVTFSDGNQETGTLKGGSVKFENAPVGKFQIEVEGYEFIFKPPGKIIKARWEKDKAKCGEEVKMIVDLQDFEDDTPAKFTVWEEDAKGKNDQIEQIDATVQGDKVEAKWTYSTEEVEEDLKEDLEEEEEGGPEYFFAVNIKGEEARSGILTFTYTLEIYLEDEDEKPLDGLGYIVTLSDGTERKGELKDGRAKIEDAPYGEFTIEVEGFDFKTKKASMKN